MFSRIKSRIILKTPLNHLIFEHKFKIMSTDPKTEPNSNPPNKVHYVEIEESHQGQRIDNFLMTYLKGVPKTHVYRIIRKGEVRVNKGRTKPVYKLSVGDIIRIPPVRVSDAKTVPNEADGDLYRLKKAILFEDDSFMIINKPPGMAVHGGSGISYGVIEALRKLYPNEKRLELVHRLDRDTSGCLLISKKISVLRAFHEMLRNNEMQKTYVALVKGRMREKEIKVEAPLRKFVTKSGERMVCVDKREGKSAITYFYPERLFGEATLVNVKLITGRTHQIRVHSQHLRHPIAGDDKYGQPDFNLAMKKQGLNRMFLHARSLRFEHPQTGEIMNPVAPLDQSLTKILGVLS